MKLSNKILIGFFGFILVYMLAAFTEIRLTGRLNVLDKETGVIENIELNNIGYLVLPDINERVIVRSAKKPRLEMLSLDGNVISGLKYSITGDTLRLDELSLEEDPSVNVYVYVGENDLRGITVDGGSVMIDDLKQRNLNVKQVSGWVKIQNSNMVKNIELTASQEADFNIIDLELDKLVINADDARIRVSSHIQRLEGTGVNESVIVTQSPNDIAFKKDDSSVLRFFN